MMKQPHFLDDPDQPRPRPRLYWQFLRYLCFWSAVLYLKARCRGQHHVPNRGGVLLVSNHQSFLDPVLATMSLRRESCYMARDSLFKNPWFKRLIESLNAFPVKRGRADLGAIKEALRRLKKGYYVVVFPEGTRSEDGRIREMLPGLSAIAKKARVPIVPVLIDGMVQSWPRTSRLPKPGDVIIEYGPAIRPDEYQGLSAEEIMNEVRSRLTRMQQTLHGKHPERRLK